MNDSLLNASDGAPLPERIVTNWRRFSSGLWRVPEGDISAAYCAETFPKVQVFMHEGRMFTNCGGHFAGPIHGEKDCYRLIPTDEYRGPQPRRYTYEGREAAYKGQVFRLGPKSVAVASTQLLKNGDDCCGCYMPTAECLPRVALIPNFSPIVSIPVR